MYCHYYVSICMFYRGNISSGNIGTSPLEIRRNDGNLMGNSINQIFMIHNLLTFPQDVLVILKHSLQNYLNILNKYLLGTRCIVTQHVLIFNNTMVC